MNDHIEAMKVADERGFDLGHRRELRMRAALLALATSVREKGLSDFLDWRIFPYKERFARALEAIAKGDDNG